MAQNYLKKSVRFVDNIDEFETLYFSTSEEICDIMQCGNFLKVTTQPIEKFTLPSLKYNWLWNIQLTSYARIEMDKHIRTLIGECPDIKILYMDTDSIMYVRPKNASDPLEEISHNAILGQFKSEIEGYECQKYVALSPKNYCLKLVNKASGEVIFKQTCKGITLKNNDFLNPNIMSQISKMHLERTHPSQELQKLKNVQQQRFQILKNHSISVGSIEKNFLETESRKRFFNQDFVICKVDKCTLPYGHCSKSEDLAVEIKTGQTDSTVKHIQPIDYSTDNPVVKKLPKYPLGPVCNLPCEYYCTIHIQTCAICCELCAAAENDNFLTRDDDEGPDSGMSSGCDDNDDIDIVGNSYLDHFINKYNNSYADRSINFDPEERAALAATGEIEETDVDHYDRMTSNHCGASKYNSLIHKEFLSFEAK